MRKLAGNLNRTQTLCLFVNQIREKVGVMFGSPETQPGGRALKFYSSQRLDIRRIETLKDGTEAVGNRVRVKVVKNKVAAPFRQAEFDIEFGKGISTSGCILDLGIEHDIVTKSGSFFSYGDERLGQGRNNAKAFLDEHQEIAKEIEGKVYEALGIGQDLVKPIDRDEGPTRRRSRRSRRPGRRRRWADRAWPASDERFARIRRDRPRRRAGRRSPEVLVEHARDLAWRALNRRDRTVDEVGGMLLGKRVEPSVADTGGRGADRARLPRRRPLRPALRRGPPPPRRLGLRADRAPAAGARGRPRAHRRRARRARTPRMR